MSEVDIVRRDKSVSVTLATTTSSASTVRLEDAAGAIVSFGTMHTSSSTIHVYGSAEEDGPYRRLYDSVGSPANITLQPSTSVGAMYALPDAIFALPYGKLVSGDEYSTGVSGTIMFKS